MKMPNASEVGARIRQWREARSWSQNDLAVSLGVHPQSVHRWEKGRVPETEDLVKLSSAFGVPIERILCGGDQDMALPQSLVDFFNTQSGKQLTGSQQLALAELLDGYDVDESALKSALFLLLSKPQPGEKNSSI